MLEKYLCSGDRTLLDAYRQMNESGKDIVFVIDGDGCLLGVITDGDIRRFILSNHGFEQRINELDLGRCEVLREGENFDVDLQKLGQRGFRAGPGTVQVLPVVNSRLQVVDAVDLRERQFLPVASPDLGDREFNYLVDAYLSGWVSSIGPYIQEFETAFSSFVGSHHGVACSNGTSALHLALLALNIGPGDEVILPDLTFAATINSVLHAGATPVIVDVDLESWTIDCNEIEKAITSKTRAIIPVHLYGQPCDMDGLKLLCEKYSLFMIEDCAEAHGARYQGKLVGSFGDVSCFSFFANKIITTGEGGMCLTNDPQLAERIRKLRDHGMSRTKKYFHDVVGFNYRMTNLQAAIGCAQVARLEEINRQRLELGKVYKEILEPFDIFDFQNDLPGRERVVWLATALVRGGCTQRDIIVRKFQENDIDCRNFFYPLSDMPIYQKYAKPSSVSKQISDRGISFPTTTKFAPEYVGRLLEAVLAENADNSSDSV